MHVGVAKYECFLIIFVQKIDCCAFGPLVLEPHHEKAYFLHM